MRTIHLHAVIETAETNYAAYVEEIPGVAATGHTLAEVKAGLLDALDFLVESCIEDGDEIPAELQGDYVIDFRMDVRSFLSVYSGIFTKSGLERLTGINQKQLWHYANGKSVPRRAQVLRIEEALHRLGEELLSIHL
ncbi:MAG: type II toxin-antitoxin system HicB family antitoxin [Bacteroidales bacterium]|nr:type II toxin-antitoxin system HicB family antitoxin [Bacteroidales bacterium]